MIKKTTTDTTETTQATTTTPRLWPKCVYISAMAIEAQQRSQSNSLHQTPKKPTEWRLAAILLGFYSTPVVLIPRRPGVLFFTPTTDDDDDDDDDDDY